MPNFNIGDRVRAIKPCAKAYRGLVGTVTKADDGVYVVEFDNPPAEGDRLVSDPHGGTWGADTLEVLKGDLVESLKADLEGVTQHRNDLAERLGRKAYELNKVKAAANEEVTRLLEKLQEAQRVIDGLTEDLTRHVALREYVEENHLDSQALHAVAGFTHGYVYGQRA